MKNPPQERFCFDKSKQVAQKGFIIPAMIVIVLILIIGGGGYVYLESKKVAKVETDTTKTEVIATSTDGIDNTPVISQVSTIGTISPEIKSGSNSSSTINKVNVKPSNNTITTQVKGGTKTVIKTSTSTTTLFVGTDGSKSSMTVSKEEEEYIKKNTVYGCGNESCFNENFKSCSPVTMTVDLGFLGKTSYEVKKNTQNICTLKFRQLTHPNPEYIDKEMICEVNNKLSFENAIAEMYSNATLKGNPSNCSGSFYEDVKYKPLPPGVTIGN